MATARKRNSSTEAGKNSVLEKPVRAALNHVEKPEDVRNPRFDKTE